MHSGPVQPIPPKRHADARGWFQQGSIVGSVFRRVGSSAPLCPTVNRCRQRLTLRSLPFQPLLRAGQADPPHPEKHQRAVIQARQVVGGRGRAGTGGGLTLRVEHQRGGGVRPASDAQPRAIGGGHAGERAAGVGLPADDEDVRTQRQLLDPAAGKQPLQHRIAGAAKALGYGKVHGDAVFQMDHGRGQCSNGHSSSPKRM